MTYSPTRHHLPDGLVPATGDRPLSGDVTGRTWEALHYLWQVVTGTADGSGSSIGTPQGHTHEGVRDQTLEADAPEILGWAFGHCSVSFEVDNNAAPKSVIDTEGRWTDGAVAYDYGRSLWHVPAQTVGALGLNAAFEVHALIEKGQVLGAPVTVRATVGGLTVIANNAALGIGLESVTLAFGAGLIGSGPQEVLIEMFSAGAGDSARIWHSTGVTA